MGCNPLFPCKYETWARRTSGRECAVIEYYVELERVAYMYLDDQETVHECTFECFMLVFKFVRSP